ncbi:hypothetical protein RHSIM_Rhsim07G0011600 [Rhododendron simsii]|uniref:Uncharacterized protein n=1 Tax=Rhododendron simsii TaxID=118357 RepID=A0A834LJM6_RHOSS|nr:hypothetical protein RHSIM_Rhsim07G0011600 [Rhododendron simsii]
MSMFDFVNNEFSKPTSIFGLNLWLLIPLTAGALTVLILLLFSLSYCHRHCRRCKPTKLTAPSHPRDVQIKVEKAENGVYWGPVRRCRAERVRRLSAEDHRLHRRRCI